MHKELVAQRSMIAWGKRIVEKIHNAQLWTYNIVLSTVGVRAYLPTIRQRSHLRCRISGVLPLRYF